MSRSLKTPAHILNGPLYLQWIVYRCLPDKLRHRGVAFYDAERMRTKLRPGSGSLLPPPDALAAWIATHCPEIDLTVDPKFTEWQSLNETWREGRFHAGNSVNDAAAESVAAEPVEFRVGTGAAYTINDPGQAATIMAAAERLRRGKLLAKDLPKHIATPPQSLTLGARTRSGNQLWHKPDATGARQLCFADIGVVCGFQTMHWRADGKGRDWVELPAAEKALLAAESQAAA